MTKAAKLAHFKQIRRRNYRASLRLEGFTPPTDARLDEQAPLLSIQEIESRISAIKARYVR